jgi:hypothetical protein
MEGIKFICKNCKYWERDRVTGYEFLGDCNSDKFIDISREHEWKRKKQKELRQKSDVLAYWDGEAIEGYFKTAENFGCIHFEVRDDVAIKLGNI